MVITVQEIRSFYNLALFCEAKGYYNFTDLQEEAFLNDEFYSKKDLFVIGETSSGKTLIAQLAIAMNYNGKALFVVPYRALAKQKKVELQNFFSDKEVVISTSEYRENDNRILSGQVDIAVIIYEKVFLFAALNPKIFAQYDTIIFDEFGLIDNEERGIKADLIFSWSKRFSNIRTVVLATPTFDWSLYADQNRFLIIKSSDRPVDLNKVDIIRHKVKSGEQKGVFTIKLRGDAPIISFENVGGKVDDILVHICSEHRKLGHKILIFDNDRTRVKEKAKLVYCKFLECGLLKKAVFANVEKFKEEILGRMNISEENLFLAFDNADFEMMLGGISFHSAALPLELRFEIENEFLNDDGILSIVFATETLAFGLNSGVDVVIIANISKPAIAEAVHTKKLISKNEYMNYIGRAGRYGKCEQGYAYTLIPDTNLKIWDEILNADIEIIESKIFSKSPNESAMYLMAIIPDSPDCITIEQIKAELSYLLINTNHLNSTHICFLDSIGEQCEMLEARKLIKQDDSSFELSYSLTDRGRKLQGYVLDIDTYDILIEAAKLFSRKQIYYFNYCFHIAQCKQLMENNDVYLTNKNVDDRAQILSYYFEKLESELEQNRHISQDILQEIRGAYLNYRYSGLNPHRTTNKYDTRLRIAMILYLRLLGITEEVIGKSCRVGYAAIKKLGEQASYYTDVVRATSLEAVVSKETDDRLKMLSISLFYGVHINALGLCDIDVISAENYRHINSLALCVELAEKIKHSQSNPWVALDKMKLKNRFHTLPEQLQSVFLNGYGGTLE